MYAWAEREQLEALCVLRVCRVVNIQEESEVAAWEWPSDDCKTTRHYKTQYTERVGRGGQQRWRT